MDPRAPRVLSLPLLVQGPLDRQLTLVKWCYQYEDLNFD